jgi:hypothetical protein
MAYWMVATMVLNWALLTVSSLGNDLGSLMAWNLVVLMAWNWDESLVLD